MFVAFSGKNSNPVGISSLTTSAYPFVSPSLYILIVYSTISEFSTTTGFFSGLIWYVYFAVVSVPFNGVTSTCGALFVI